MSYRPNSYWMLTDLGMSDTIPIISRYLTGRSAREASKKGETLSKIAEQYYGDTGLYPTIFEANKDILTNPNLIKIGQKLRIP